MKKKIISLLLAIVMILSMMPVALASDAPFAVKLNGEELELVRNEELLYELEAVGLPIDAVFDVTVPAGSETVAVESGECTIIAASQFNDFSANHEIDSVPVIEGDYILLIDAETYMPRFALRFIVEAGCEHEHTTNTYARIEGTKTHTITKTCDDCGEQIGQKTADCADKDADSVCDKCGGALTNECDHANATTAYAQVEGTETHTVTTTCGDCGEVITGEAVACTDINQDGKCDVCKGAVAIKEVTADKQVNIKVGHSVANPVAGATVEVPVYVSYNYSPSATKKPDTGYFYIQVNSDELALTGISKEGNQHFSALSSVNYSDQGSGKYKVEYKFTRNSPGTQPFKLLCTLTLTVKDGVKVDDISAVQAVTEAIVYYSSMSSRRSETYTMQNGSVTFVDGCLHKGTETTTTYEQVAGTETHYVNLFCECGEQINQTTEACVDATAEGEANDGKCNTCLGDMKVPVTGVTLDQAEITVNEGSEPITLTATVAPEIASNKNVIWTTDDAKVATVTDGVVTFVGPGTATITVTTVDGGFSASCVVKVQSLDPEALAAPVLDETKAVRNINYIILAAPEASKQDPNAKVMYSMYNGLDWSAWQESPRFDNLIKGTTYKFRAKYVAADTLVYADSAAGEEISLATREELKVTFRLTGSSLPTKGIFFSTTAGEYYGAEYQTWIKTEEHKLTGDITAWDLAQLAMTNHGFTYTTNSVTAPEYFGGHTLTSHDTEINHGTNASQIGWTVTIRRGGVYYDGVGMTSGTLSDNVNSIATELHDGDEVIISFSWAFGHENVTGSYRGGSTAYLQNYLKAPDLSVAEWQQVDAMVIAINALVVTPDNIDTINTVAAAYDALTDLQKENVDAAAKAYLEFARKSVAEYAENGTMTLAAPVLSSTAAEILDKSITLTVPAASKQDSAATVEYAISSDGGKNWSDWQTSPTFTGLTPSTDYSFKARFVPSDAEGIYKTSDAGDAVTFKSAAFVSFRVIGATKPLSVVKNNAAITNISQYNSGEYQNWLKSTPVKLFGGESAFDVIDRGLTENGFSWSGKYNTFSVTTPDGTTLTESSGTLFGSSATWYVTIIRNGATVVEKDYIASSTGSNYAGGHKVQAGDQVILHVSYAPKAETTTGSYYAATAEAGFGQYYLQVPDLTPEEKVAKDNVIALIDAIGPVTAESAATIEAVRAAYNALTDDAKAYVTNYKTLTAAEEKLANLDNLPALTAPVISEAYVTGTTINLGISGCIEDQGATFQYRISADGTNWSEWQNDNVFTRLASDTTYYFQARFVPSASNEEYKTSEPSEIFEAKTDPAQIVDVTSRKEWDKAISGAPVDSTELIINLKGDIAASDIDGSMTAIPDGTVITVVGAGGKLAALTSENGAMNRLGLQVGSNSVLTLKNITYYSFDSKDDTNMFGSMIKFMGSNAVVNLENVTVYGDGAIISSRNRDVGYNTLVNDNNVVNIYSGAFTSLNSSEASSNFIKQSYNGIGNTTLNLIPTGDIIIEGPFTDVNSVNLIAQEGHTIKSGSFRAKDGTYTALTAEQLTAQTISTANCHGLRLITSENGTAMPEKLAAPAITVENLEVGVGGVTIPELVPTEANHNAVLQIRVDKNNELAGVVTQWLTIEQFPYELTLAETITYPIEFRYKVIGGNWADSPITKLEVRTGFNEIKLDAPVLRETDNIGEDSVTLHAVDACTVAKANAVAQYRVSTDKQTWSDWQTSTEFNGLTAGTYYFQARYFTETDPYINSDPSDMLEVEIKGAAVAFGDLNNDGLVDDDDTKLLREYLAGKSVEINAAAADVNEDGKIDLIDLVILRRYMADMDGFGELPYKPAV